MYNDTRTGETFYNLSSSMAARVNFDSMAHQCGYDAAGDLSVEELQKLDSIAIKYHAEGAWLGAISCDIDEQVDDVEEAEARFISAWQIGFEVKKDEKIKEVAE